jgi:hypothetical protein
MHACKAHAKNLDFVYFNVTHISDITIYSCILKILKSETCPKRKQTYWHTTMQAAMSCTRVKIEKINNLFQVDINRREQGCAAHYEQYCCYSIVQL